MGPIFQLIYLSRAKDSLSHSDIDQILESSRKRNLENQVTGILMFKDGFFLQVLEGPEVQVFETLSRIVKDRRHHHVQVQVECLSNVRTFEKWQMAFFDGDLRVSTEIDEQLQKIFKIASGAVYDEKESLVQHLKCFRGNVPKQCVKS